MSPIGNVRIHRILEILLVAHYAIDVTSNIVASQINGPCIKQIRKVTARRGINCQVPSFCLQDKRRALEIRLPWFFVEVGVKSSFDGGRTDLWSVPAIQTSSHE